MEPQKSSEDVGYSVLKMAGWYSIQEMWRVSQGLVYLWLVGWTNQAPDPESFDWTCYCRTKLSLDQEDVFATIA